MGLAATAANFHTSPLYRTDLCVSASNLDDFIKLCPLSIQRAVEFLEARQEPLVDLQGHSYMHGGGKGVVGTLAPIDMVVGMYWGFGAKLSTQNLNSPMG